MQAVIWSKYNCAYCDQAKALLNQNNISYEERKIGNGWDKEDLLKAVPTARTVPQIFLNEEYVGGFTELKQKLTQG
jgi:glutaredoxin 3